MDPTLAQRLDRYEAWLDHAEDQIDAWFNATQVSNPSAPGAPIDHRALNSIVLTLRRVITLRQTLRDWSRRENPPAPPESPDPSQEAMEAWDRVLSFYRKEDPKPSDAHHHNDAPHISSPRLEDNLRPADLPPNPDIRALNSNLQPNEVTDANPVMIRAIPWSPAETNHSPKPAMLPSQILQSGRTESTPTQQAVPSTICGPSPCRPFSPSGP